MECMAASGRFGQRRPRLHLRRLRGRGRCLVAGVAKAQHRDYHRRHRDQRRYRDQRFRRRDPAPGTARLPVDVISVSFDRQRLDCDGREAQLVQAFGGTDRIRARWRPQQFRRMQQPAAQVGEHRGHVGIACGRPLGQHAFDDRLQRGKLRRQFRYRPRQVRDQQVGGALGLVGRPAGQHLEPHRSQAVLVGAAVDGIVRRSVPATCSSAFRPPGLPG